MIVLPTRRRLAIRRDEIYEHLQSIMQHASVHQVEDAMRRIHIVNLRLRTYFSRQSDPKPVFDNEDT